MTPAGDEPPQPSTSKPQSKDSLPVEPGKYWVIWQTFCMALSAFVLSLVVGNEKVAVGWRVTAGVAIALIIGAAVYVTAYAAQITIRQRWVVFVLVNMLPLAVFLFLFVDCAKGLSRMRAGP